MPVPQQCSAAIKYLNISPVACVCYQISPSAQMKDQNVPTVSLEKRKMSVPLDHPSC